MRCRTPRFALTLGVMFLLAACGGGSDDSAAPAPGPAPSPAPTPAPAPGPAPSPSPSPAPATAGTCGFAGFATALLDRVNTLRAAGASCGSSGSFGPAGSLRWNTQLTQSSDGHSRDMATLNYFSHTSADGRTLADRINASGYSWSRIGENIAAGQRSVDEVMNGWIASPGHCANLMNPNYADIGVACVPRVGSATYSHYWTMNLGTPR